MANTVYLHVGTPKSGTTYIQAVLGANKARLADQAGLLYPGESWDYQVRAARDLLDAHPHGAASHEIEGAWQRLVGDVGAWSGDAVVSMEWLGSARPDQARRMVESLQPARVEIIVTARDLARTVPAAWQEFVQNWNTWTWPEFLTAIASENPKSTEAGQMFWTQQDLTRLFAIWRDVLPAEQLHLVTLPRSGAAPGELWARFASVLGVDSHRFDSSGGGGNESLGLESAELMRRLNLASRTKNLPWNIYDSAFKNALAKRGLSARKPSETTLTLPEDVREWVVACSVEQIETVRASGVQLVGDITDLEPHFRDLGKQPHEVCDSQLLDAALDGLVFLARHQGGEIGRLRHARADLRHQLDDRVRTIEEQARTIEEQARTIEVQESKLEASPVRRALVQLSERHRWLMRLRVGYRRALDTLGGKQQ